VIGFTSYENTTRSFNYMEGVFYFLCHHLEASFVNKGKGEAGLDRPCEHQEVEATRISRYEDGNVASPTPRPSLPPEETPDTHFR
jgi:hypothetical protein